MRGVRGVVLLAIVLVTTGCGASITGGHVADPTASPRGIRYRVAVPYEVRIYYVDGDRVKIADAEVIALPSTSELREINYRGALARSYEFTVNLRDNGTLADVALQAKGDAQAAAAAGVVEETIKAFKEREEQRDPAVREKRKLDRENELLEAKKKNRDLRRELGE